MKKSDAVLNRYLLEIGRIPVLKPDAEAELGHRIQNGDTSAREQMINGNLRLVVTIARDYVDLGLPLIDLIAEGNIGLMKSVDRFDPSKGAKLSSYASWWIKQAIKRALANQSKTVRLPTQVINKVSRIHRISVALSNELGHEATEDELAEELGIPAQDIARLQTTGLRPASLDAPIDDGELTSLAESIPDEKALSPVELLRDKDLSGNIERALEALPQREATIIAHRFGLNGTTAKTLQQVSELIGLTRERVRQLETAAIEKLRRAFKKHLGLLQAEALVPA
jgi:RNA polymerase primary sigma factor